MATTQISIHILEHVTIPKYDSSSAVHVGLSRLSKEAHVAKAKGNQKEVEELEKMIDEVGERVFGG